MTVKELIQNVEDLKVHLNEISVYDLDVHTSMDLYYTIAKKFNVVIKELSRFEGVVSDEVIKQNEKLVYLLGEGLNSEVVNKINNMVLDGTMDKIINTELFNDLNSQIKEKANEIDLNVLKNRIDGFTSLPQGSTTGDAELIDGRVAIDGIVYNNIGGAIRNQIKNIVEISGSDIFRTEYITIVSMLIVSNLQIFRDSSSYGAHKGVIIPIKPNTYYKLGKKQSSDTFRAALLNDSEGKSTGTIYTDLNRLIINDNTKNEIIFYSGSYTYLAYQHTISGQTPSIVLLEDYNVKLKDNLNISEITNAKKDKNNKIYDTLKDRLDYQQNETEKCLSSSNLNIYDNTVAETYNDFNNFPINKVVLVSAYQNTILNAPYTGFVGNVITYSYSKDSDVNVVQISINSSNEMYFRSKYGSDWRDWKQVITELPEYKQPIDYMLMFHKIGGIGDSLMTGELAYGLESENWQGHYKDRPTFSWLSNIARTTGAEYVCYSEGGLKCSTWFSRGWDTKLKNEEKKCNAYFIGLGTNDKNYDGYDIGSIDDTSEANSFVGYYKKIIETIQTAVPNAVVFCLSLYAKGKNDVPYNNMIQAITSKYDKCYFIDFANKSDILLTDNNYISWGHFDTLGYIRVADNIKRICNEVIEANKNDFSMFGWDNE